jgi:hypothetical protein
MRRLLGLLASLSLTSFVLVWSGCSSTSEGQAPATPEQAFCSAVGESLQKCTNTATSCAAVVTDCAKITTLLNPSLLEAATACIKSSSCDNGGPLSCLGRSIGKVKASAPQQAFATHYCEGCSVVPGEACTTAFYPTEGVPGLGVLLLPFGDGIVTAVDEACTSSKLGKTACQSSFSTCVGIQAAKSLAQTLSVDTASCLVSSIQAGIANAGAGDGGAAEDGGEAGTGDGGAACNTLANTAPTIVSENITGTAPVPAGGTIAEGTYYLLSVKNYGAAIPDTSFKDTLAFSNGTQYDVSFMEEGVAEPTRESAIFTAAGTTFTRSFTCPKGETRVRQYTATDKTFTLFSSGVVFLYTKQ